MIALPDGPKRIAAVSVPRSPPAIRQPGDGPAIALADSRADRWRPGTTQPRLPAAQRPHAV